MVFLLVNSINLLPLPTLDAKEGCLGPFVRVSKVAKTKENKDKREEERTGGGKELESKIKLGEYESQAHCRNPLSIQGEKNIF